ncbi:MAG: methylamine utilization protein [Burkholderiales bacterium]|nr:methylamine utilization protein [Burkholderiales bacterium]
MPKSCFAALILALSGWAQAASVEIHLVDGAGKPLADAAAYLEPLGSKVPASKATAVIDQVDKEFVPLVTVMQTGTLVRFPNRDNIRHHVYSFSPAKTFDLPLYSGTKADPVLFDKPGQVVLGCNIHDWMIAYALVVDTPWFGKSNEQGLVKIDDIPPGEYTARAWHPYQAADAAAQTIKVGAPAEPKLHFQIKLAPQPPRPKPKSY